MNLNWIANEEGSLRRISKRDSQELMGVSLYDTKEGGMVKVDLWIPGLEECRRIAADIVRCGRKRVLYSERVQR